MLTFSWPKTEWNRSALPGFILLSAFVHSLAFVLLQVVPKEKATAPQREREIELLSWEVPEHQALLAAVEADSPVAALSHQLLPVADLLARTIHPASLQPKAPLLEPPLWKSRAGSVVTNLWARHAATPETPPTHRPPRLQLHAREQERLQSLPPLPDTPKGRLLESPVFLLGIGGDGAVQFVLLQQSSGDNAADQLVEQTLKGLVFKGGQSQTQWSTATFIWGNSPAE
jgi:hypothetical protein